MIEHERNNPHQLQAKTDAGVGKAEHRLIAALRASVTPIAGFRMVTTAQSALPIDRIAQPRDKPETYGRSLHCLE